VDTFYKHTERVTNFIVVTFTCSGADVRKFTIFTNKYLKTAYKPNNTPGTI